MCHFYWSIVTKAKTSWAFLLGPMFEHVRWKCFLVVVDPMTANYIGACSRVKGESGQVHFVVTKLQDFLGFHVFLNGDIVFNHVHQKGGFCLCIPYSQ